MNLRTYEPYLLYLFDYPILYCYVPNYYLWKDIAIIQII